MLPRLDGFGVLRAARAARVRGPVLMLTARDAVADKVTGLDAGADDYLTKPFSFDEFLARVRALLRRADGRREPVLRLPDLTLRPPRPAGAGAAPAGSSSQRASTLCSSICCATPGACSRGRCWPSTSGDWTSTPRATLWTSTSAISGASSTAPARPGCSRRSAAWGTCCGRTTEVWRPLSIHTRLTLWYTGVLLGTLVVVGAVGYWLLAWSLAQDIDRSLLTVAEVLRDRGDDGAEDPVERALRQTLGSDGLERFFQIVDPEGRARVRSPRASGRPGLPLSPTARDNAVR